ncbi:MAG: DJ-1/PfpI family protein [Spirochaetes bacterium]|nr:DJ-1/PfpI family protein [Spirochaetota bacterium]
MKRACVLLADGCEEVEAVTIVDYLRRAGVEVVAAGVTGINVKGGHGILLGADELLSALVGESFDAVVVPGGMKGAAHIAASEAARALIQSQFSSGALVAAICAAPPVVLYQACGILKGRRFTCYPGMEEEAAGASFCEGNVVVDGNLITSRGPGTAGEFALALVSTLVGEDAARKLAKGTLLLA